MAIQLKQLLPYIILLSIFSISQAKKPCKCSESDSDQDRRSYHTFDDSGYVFRLIDKQSGIVRRAGINIVSNVSDAGVLSTINRWIKLWQDRPDGRGVDEASFSVTIVYQPTPEVYSGLTFLIIPVEMLENLDQANSSLAKQLLASDNAHPLRLSNPTTRNAPVPGASVTVTIGMLLVDQTLAGPDNVSIIGVEFTINPTSGAAAAYKVWIDYDRVSLSFYVDMASKPKPVDAIADQKLSISRLVPPYLSFNLVSTSAELLLNRTGIDFRAVVEDLPRYDGDKGIDFRAVFSVLGPVAAASAMVAAGMAWYFNSRYRQWQKDLDQLARSMERLPGVPTKVDFADISKATGNFNEEKKLGRGGFGTVYRCTLSAAARKTDLPMDVAVKRFTRDVQNHRYDDFLSEVSIINRLRHKNIVPLMGWSYDKGVPLLVFEYMTNGSLDQHLFPRGGGGTGQPRNGAIQQWATRYDIVKDIATGLHYVHHEYEPMVLHRDIKASNVMLDSNFRARLGDFGLACTVSVDRNSVTGVGGTWGYIAPEYAMCGKTTRQTDIYALGVLILEVVTGQRALADHRQVVDDDDVHITDRVWRLHHEGRLSESVDAVVLAYAAGDDKGQMDAGEVARLLLLGLACSNPNPSARPTMPEVVQVIAKAMPAPEVPPVKPRFVWPPPEGMATDDDSTFTVTMSDLDTSMEEQQVGLGQPMTRPARAARRHASFQLQSAHERATGRHASFQLEHSV